KLIAELRREKGLTQKAVAEKLGICAKTVSKWETGHGFPDVSLVAKLSEVFGIDISRLLEGEMPKIRPEVGNVKRTKFYVCEKCGNLMTSMGNAEILCCGRKLSPLLAKAADKAHVLNVEKIEDDYYITFEHPMTKEHYISFVAYVRFDRVLTVKLYPEQDGELRFPQIRGGKMYYFCNEHGLFELKI
ncbi:MAG: helix-turn-helix domain-containing protein, partial [Clostridia bacterium]|nr:helix-turn-helix domain-containing protein [Clostridia bacterium]